MQDEQSILIVDDTDTNIEILINILKGYDVLVATNGLDALDILENEKVNLILLDIMMPEMDGYEVCEKIKKNIEIKDIPIIFLTAKTDEESIEKAFDMGAVDFVSKPFKPKELISRVKTHLKITKLINNLEDKNEEINHLLNTTMEAVFVLEGDICVDVNSEAIKLFNCKNKDDVIRKSILEFNIMNLFERSDEIPYEIEAIKCDGSTFPALVRYKNLNIRNKKIGVFAVLDLTDIKEKEVMLSQKSKMESMGEMISNIAHQWRQPLSVISTSASGMLLQHEFGTLDDDLMKELNGAVIESCDILSKTIDDFQDLTTSYNTDKYKFYLDKLLFSLSDYFKKYFSNSEIDLNIEVRENFEVHSYKKGLEQVILNILKNAKDILSEKKNIEKKLIFIEVKEVESKVQIEIYDNGGGIKKENLEKVFDPYFTTKHKTHGTGLGLYSSFNIIKNMGGTLGTENIIFTYEGVQFEGAKFIITL